MAKKLYHTLAATASTQQNRKQEFTSFPPEVQKSRESLRLRKKKKVSVLLIRVADIWIGLFQACA